MSDPFASPAAPPATPATPAPAVKADPLKVKTGEFRVSFPAVFTPKESLTPGQPAKFTLTMLFPVAAIEAINAMKAAAAAACEKKWGADRAKWPRPMRSPFGNGEEKDYDGYKGHVYINATSAQKPGIVDAALQPITDETKFYAGCYARATVVAYAYDKAGNRGVAFSLHNVQKLRDGAPFGSRRAAGDDFEALATPAQVAQTAAKDMPDF